MASRTQIVCLHEGTRGRSIDPVFINKTLRGLCPGWIRPWTGNNIVRLEPCGGRAELIKAMPNQLKGCLSMGGHTTLMVWADLDDDMPDGDSLKDKFWQEASSAGILRAEFDHVVFIFAKDRLENWIEFLLTGKTDESSEGPRVNHDRHVAEAAKLLIDRCKREAAAPALPPSLEWSCRNWKKLVTRVMSA